MAGAPSEAGLTGDPFGARDSDGGANWGAALPRGFEGRACPTIEICGRRPSLGLSELAKLAEGFEREHDQS